MVPNLDIYRSANVLVKQHGQDAPIHAAMNADAVLEAGDLEIEGTARRGYGSIARKPASPSRNDHSSSNPLEKKSDEAPAAYYRLREFPARIRLWTSVDNGHGA